MSRRGEILEGSDWVVAILGGGTLSSIVTVIVSKFFENRKNNRDREDGLDKYWVTEIKEDKQNKEQEIKKLQERMDDKDEEFRKVYKELAKVSSKVEGLEKDLSNSNKDNVRLRRERNAARDEAKKWKESFTTLQIKFNEALKKIEKMKEGI